MLVVGAVHAALETRLGRRVAPDSRHVSADPKAQDDREKNSRAGPGGSK
jgi:hypothetical protein